MTILTSVDSFGASKRCSAMVGADLAAISQMSQEPHPFRNPSGLCMSGSIDMADSRTFVAVAQGEFPSTKTTTGLLVLALAQRTRFSSSAALPSRNCFGFMTLASSEVIGLSPRLLELKEQTFRVRLNGGVVKGGMAR